MMMGSMSINHNHRLTSVEGQRVLAILDDCIQKLGYLSLLKKDALSLVDSAHLALGEDASTFMVQNR